MQLSQIKHAQRLTAQVFQSIGIVLTESEQDNIEITNFGLNDFEQQGLALLTYINTDRYCAKELYLFPNQTCPEHTHPPIGDSPGKMETFRCRWGKVFLYVEGERTNTIQAKVPDQSKAYYTVFHEIELNPGEQYTIPPNTLHWFQSGSEGAVVSEFSSTSYDEYDIFTDSNVVRISKDA